MKAKNNFAQITDNGSNGTINGIDEHSLDLFLTMKCERT